MVRYVYHALFCANLSFLTLVHISASDRDIRAAYKRLSKKFHPDKNKASDAEERFVEIARGASIQPVLFVMSDCPLHFSIRGSVRPRSKHFQAFYMHKL